MLILSKLTRYDYERMKFKSLSDKDFEQKLRNRGTNFDKLKYHNVLQRNNIAKIANILKDMGSDVKVVNRYVVLLKIQIILLMCNFSQVFL